LRKGYKSWRIENLKNRAQIHIVNLLDFERVCTILNSIKPHWVFNLAAYGAYSSQKGFGTMVQTNLISTVNMLEAFLKVGGSSFVHGGSSSEYGFKKSAPSEKEFLEPNSHYSISKAGATHYCMHAAKAHSANISVLRLYSAYGPYEEPTRLIPTLIIKGLENSFPVLASPNNSRDYVHVKDVCHAFLLAANAKGTDFGRIYNVGTGVQTTLEQVVALIKRRLHISSSPIWETMPNRNWDTESWVADPRKIRQELSWQPNYTLEEGLTDTLNWFESNTDIMGFYRELILKNKLPS